MAELLEAINQRLIADNAVEELVMSDDLQYGTEAEPLVGADFLPQRLDARDQWRENFAGIIRGFVSDDSSAYSPPQIKHSGLQTGSFQIEQGSIKVASEFTAKDIEALIHQGEFSEDNVYLRVLDWITQSLVLSAHRKAEIQRWQMIVNGVVRIAGLDGRLYDIPYPNPPQQRRTIPSGTIAAPAGWYSDTYDPVADILAVKSFLVRSGRQIIRIIGDDQVTSALRNNDTMKDRLGGVVVSNGTLTTFRGEIEKNRIDDYFQNSLGIPPIEEFNTTYINQNDQSFPYKSFGSLVFFTRTQIRNPNGETNNAIGYYARGRARGEIDPGIKVRIKYRDIDPVGLYGESITAGIPVLQDPNAIAVIVAPLPAVV